MVEHKPAELSNNYLYISDVSVVGIAIAGYLLYRKFKRPEQNLIGLSPPSNISNVNTKIELKRDIFEMYLKISVSYIYVVENYMKDFKESVYHSAVISALAIGYTVLGKTLIKMSPPSLRKYDAEDGAKWGGGVIKGSFQKHLKTGGELVLKVSPPLHPRKF